MVWKKVLSALVLAVTLAIGTARADGLMLNAVTTTGPSAAVNAANQAGVYAIDAQIWSAAGSVATVVIECRSYTTAPWWPCQTITNPDSVGVFYSLPLAFQYRLNVTAWTNGSISGTLILYKR